MVDSGAPVSAVREEGDEGRGGFANMEKFRGLTVNIKFPTILGLK